MTDFLTGEFGVHFLKAIYFSWTNDIDVLIAPCMGLINVVVMKGVIRLH